MAIVIIVDDSLLSRSLVRRLLEERGHSVIEAVDGNDGLEKIVSTPVIDLVITDYNMPGCDGLTMLSNAKKQRQQWSFPIFLITTESTVGFIKNARDLGVTLWIRKPVNEAMLIAGIVKVLG